MPELPEVETIRRGLERRLPGRRIVEVRVRERRLRTEVDVAALQSLRDLEIRALGRRAKYLLLHLAADRTLVIHLGMSGRILLLEDGGLGKPLDRHDHVVWRLQGDGDALELRLRDPRRFGQVLAVRTSELERHPAFAHLGPDPFDEALTAAYLRGRAGDSRRPVKNYLMDATVVTGIGNIYANEALWRARVRPTTAAGRISLSRWKRLRRACREVLREAIEEGGTTLSDYRDASGNLGYFGMRLQVYDREGEPCRRCDGRIRRQVLAGRSTFHCPGCQH